MSHLEGVDWAAHIMSASVQNMSTNHGRLDVPMVRTFPDGSDVATGVEQVGRDLCNELNFSAVSDKR